MKIKTGFWKEQDVEKWRHKVDKMNFFYGIFFTANFLHQLIVGGSIAMTLINAIPLTTAVIIMISKNKYSKEVKECQNKKNKQ